MALRVVPFHLVGEENAAARIEAATDDPPELVESIWRHV